jgi:TonB family protein
MTAATLLFAAALAQAPGAANTQTDCAVAMARSTSGATAQVCLPEAELGRAQAEAKDSAAWKRHMETAAALYKKAFTLPADDLVKSTIVERLLRLYDAAMLNDETEMLAAFRELISLQPHEARPLLRLAAYQESRGAIDAAEETLLSARRLRTDDIEPLRVLAQFYSRRAGAMHASAVKQDAREETPPGAPDKDGIYRVGGGITPPRRFGNASYPADALAAGVDGAVVAEILVDESGIVVDARVLRSIPPLDDAALKAVREWRYDPTIVDGKPVPVKMTVTVNFSRK